MLLTEKNIIANNFSFSSSILKRIGMFTHAYQSLGSDDDMYYPNVAISLYTCKTMIDNTKFQTKSIYFELIRVFFLVFYLLYPFELTQK